MQIQIPKQKFKVTPRLRKHIEDKLQQGLGKFADRIGPVVVKCGTGSLNGSVQHLHRGGSCRGAIGTQRYAGAGAGVRRFKLEDAGPCCTEELARQE
jgi:hypothetical protein